mmetsp:Transcript_109950/g.306415  ORF Transcript_109950/g.306415 Transcript_109950/m.306415 type:complete len:256 (-) Transcript_109950:295-1062(-)
MHTVRVAHRPLRPSSEHFAHPLNGPRVAPTQVHFGQLRFFERAEQALAMLHEGRRAPRQMFHLLQDVVQCVLHPPPSDQPLAGQLHHRLHHALALPEALGQRLPFPLADLLLQEAQVPKLHRGLERRQIADGVLDVVRQLALRLQLRLRAPPRLRQAPLHGALLLQNLPLALCSELCHALHHVRLLLQHPLLALGTEVRQLSRDLCLFLSHLLALRPRLDRNSCGGSLLLCQAFLELRLEPGHLALQRRPVVPLR